MNGEAVGRVIDLSIRTVMRVAIFYLAIKHRHDISGVVWGVLLLGDVTEAQLK